MSERLRPQDLRNPSQRAANADRASVPVGWGPAPFKPSQPEGGDPDRRIILPGCDYPPADAIPVDIIGEADITSTGGGGVGATVATIIVPDTLTLRVAGIGWSAEDESALRFLSWSALASPPGSTVTPYVNMPAGIGSVAQPSWVFIVLGSSVTFSLFAKNNSVSVPTVIYHFFVRVQGWLYSEKVRS